MSEQQVGQNQPNPQGSPIKSPFKLLHPLHDQVDHIDPIPDLLQDVPDDHNTENF